MEHLPFLTRLGWKALCPEILVDLFLRALRLWFVCRRSAFGGGLIAGVCGLHHTAALGGFGSPTKLDPKSWPVSHGLPVDVGVTPG